MQGYIIPNLGKANSRACTFAAARVMEKCGITAVMPEAMQREFPIRSVSFQPKEQGLKNSDFIIAIGGDGTILHTAQDAVRYDLPVLGINAGRVGFLATMERDETDLISQIASGNYSIEERMLIEASTNAESCWAVNDVVLTRGEYSRIVDIDIFCDGNPLYSLRGDGVILSTPTGSTAYAMSAGGPVVDPAIQSISLSPICPYTLFSRTILFAPDRKLTLRAKHVNNDSDLILSADGSLGMKVPVGQDIQVSRSQKVFKLIRFSGKGFYEVLNQKLMWGGSHE
ncbi:MAG: NAD(+)/NADH kinase [Oscillospiraceae bacterium]